MEKEEIYVPYLTQEEDDEKYINTLLNEATKNGKKEMINTLYKNGLSKEEISKYLNISIEELDNILSES